MLFLKIIKVSLLFLCLSWLIYDYVFAPIPRIIHYVWVGGKPEPEHVKRVIATWKEHAPNYRIHRIDETNCDVKTDVFVRSAYQHRAWEFVADYCRFIFLEKEGGLYLDTDHILKTNPDELLRGADRVFTMERLGQLSASFVAVKPNDPIIKELNLLYRNLIFSRDYFRYYYMSPVAISMVVKNHLKIDLNRPFYEKDGTRILPTNVAMIDFGGGENVAEHLYDGFGSGDAPGTWYLNFKELFLNTATIHLCTPDKKFFIRTSDLKGYLFDTKEKADILSLGLRSVKLRWQKDKTTIQYRKKGDCYYPIKGK